MLMMITVTIIIMITIRPDAVGDGTTTSKATLGGYPWGQRRAFLGPPFESTAVVCTVPDEFSNNNAFTKCCDRKHKLVYERSTCVVQPDEFPIQGRRGVPAGGTEHEILVGNYVSMTRHV